MQTAKPAKSEHRIIGLDLIRATAILAVLLAHTIPFLNLGKKTAVIEGLCTLWSVEFFFVLSGFLIGTILVKIHNQENKTSFQQIKIFWVRRWFRTLPNYYLMLIVYALLYFLSKRLLIFDDIHHLAYFAFLQNAVSYHPDDFFRVAWSLCIEEWFYLTFPLALLLMQRFISDKFKSVFFTIISFIVICLVLRIILAENYDLLWDEGFRKIMPLRLDAIATGVLAALIKYYYPEKWMKNTKASALAGLAGLVLLGLLFYNGFITKFDFRREEELGEISFFLKTFFFTLNSLAIAMLIPFFYSLKFNTSGYFSRFVIMTSSISYSMYLLHPIFIMIIYRFMGNYNGKLIFILVWVLTYIGSYLQYTLFEKKMTALREGIGQPKDAVGVLG